MKAALVVLVLHWGGFVGGTPAMMAPHVEKLARPGVEVVVPAYPLGDPDAAQTAVMNLARRLHHHHRVIAYGTSAGATLALRLRQAGMVDGAVAIAPLIDVAGYGLVNNFAWTASATAVSPSRYRCGATRTNTLIVHGRQDDVAPFAASRGFARRCHTRFMAFAATHRIIGRPRHAVLAFVRRLERRLPL